MMRSCFLFLFLILSGTSVFGLDLGDAVTHKLITAEIIGTGGYHGESIKITLQNRTRQPLKVRIPAGWIFESEEEQEQDLMVAEEQVLVLAPNARKSAFLYTMCTQSYNASPARLSTFLLGAFAKPSLLALAELINEKKYWERSASQSMVWKFANENKQGLRSIYGSDTVMMEAFAQLVVTYFKIPRDQIEFNKVAKPIPLTSISTSVDTLLKAPLKNASMKVFDPNGELVKTYFENKELERGYFHRRFGVFHRNGDTAAYTVELRSGDELVYRRQVTSADTVVKVHKLKTGLMDFHYSLEKNERADLGIYDGEGNLYHLVKEGHPFRAGNHFTQLNMTTYLPHRDDYFVKIIADDRVLTEQKIDPSGQAAKKRYPRKIERGVVNFKLDEPLKNVKVAVYDESGKLIRELYANSSFGHGYKQVKYMFFHWQGPEAKFFVRIQSEETGETLLEKVIK